MFLILLYLFLCVELWFMDRTALLIRRDEEFLFVKNDDESSGEWSPVMRQIERGETLREAARNETRRVTGVEIEIIEKVTRTEIGSGNERIHWYLVGEESATEENPDPDQIDVSEENHEWFHHDEIEGLELDDRSEEFFQENGGKLLQG